ncbi:MAG: hypothetical protein MI750_06945 [Xanthomonadales bacterium]|nr:hypothetical protein [Xanthomonadales bacterium]
MITIAEKIKNTGALLTTHQQLLVPFGCTKRNSPPHASVAINIKLSGGETKTITALLIQVITTVTTETNTQHKKPTFNPR